VYDCEYVDGAVRIRRERHRQVQQEGFRIEHDDKLVDEELAWAALCYIAPSQVYLMGERTADDGRKEVVLRDPWPTNTALVDKRRKRKRRRKLTRKQRIRDLEKAGALIAAEIDRLVRAEEAEANSEET